MKVSSLTLECDRSQNRRTTFVMITQSPLITFININHIHKNIISILKVQTALTSQQKTFCVSIKCLKGI